MDKNISHQAKRIILKLPGTSKLNKIRKKYKIIIPIQNIQKHGNNLDNIITPPTKDEVKEAKENNYLLDYMDKHIKKRCEADKAYREAFKYAAKLYRNENNTTKKEVFNKALTGLNIDEISESVIKQAGKSKIPLTEAASFRTNLTMRSRKKQLGDFAPEWKLNHKTKSYDFIDALGVRRPWISKEIYKCKDIPFSENTVVKPLSEAGSRGVYLLYSEDTIFAVKNKVTVKNFDDLRDLLRKDIGSGKIKKDRWIVQELLFSDEDKSKLPRDLKFYCFYGKVAIVLEVRRLPEPKRCWWDTNGDIINTGNYEDSFFKGNGITEEQLKIASHISSEIPAPFIRIDFLKTNEGLVFGEFTPRPGLYETFNKETDQWLGDLFMEAEGRLINDLLQGKTFDNYKNYLSKRKGKQLQQ